MHTAVVIVPLFSHSSCTLALCLEFFVVLNSEETRGRPSSVFSVGYVDSIKQVFLFSTRVCWFFSDNINDSLEPSSYVFG